MKSLPNPVLSVLFALPIAVGAGAVYAAVPQEGVRPQNAPSRTQKIGEVTISGSDELGAVQNTKRGTLDVDLHGKRVTVSSARYSLTAPHITLSVKGHLLDTGTAAGGDVLVIVRNPEQQQNTTLHCQSAIYTGARSGKPARLNLPGPFNYVLRDPQLETPLESTASHGYIEFLPDGTNRLQFYGVDAKVTPKESPAAAPKKK